MSNVMYIEPYFTSLERVVKTIITIAGGSIHILSFCQISYYNLIKIQGGLLHLPSSSTCISNMYDGLLLSIVFISHMHTRKGC